MTLVSVEIPPGVFPDLPTYSAKGLWRDSDRIRFVGGRVENIGGWSALSTAKTIGVPRAMLAWTLLNGTRVLAVATHLKLYIQRGGRYYDITPVRLTGTLLADQIYVFAGQRTVSVAVVAHGARVGDYFRISGATAINGISYNGEWVVTEIPTADFVVFQHTQVAPITTNGGGASATYAFDIHAGRQHALPGLGYGMGAYGRGSYGTSRVGQIIRKLRMPTLSLWGEDLVACIDGLYHWDASTDVTTRAQAIAGAPADNIGAVISANDRHMLVMGAGGDPMTIKWPDQGTLTSWTAAVDSTAGDIRLYDGSRIVSAAVVQNTVLVWTDTALYGIDFVNQLETSHRTYRIGNIDPPLGWNSVVVEKSTAWWLGANQIYRYDGRISVVTTDMTETIFQTMDRQQAEKACGTTNNRWNEIIWYYPQRSTTVTPAENSRYAKINTITAAPDIGTMQRSACIDAGVFRDPLASAPDGTIFRHEIPNIDNQISITFKSKKYPSSLTEIVHGPYYIVPTTQKLDRRIRGRCISMHIRGTMRCDGDVEQWFIESGVFDISEGANIMQILQIIPDFFFREAVCIGTMRFDIIADGEQ